MHIQKDRLGNQDFRIQKKHKIMFLLPLQAWANMSLHISV